MSLQNHRSNTPRNNEWLDGRPEAQQKKHPPEMPQTPRCENAKRPMWKSSAEPNMGYRLQEKHKTKENLIESKKTNNHQPRTLRFNIRRKSSSMPFISRVPLLRGLPDVPLGICMLF
jgi:hypothetical protein